MSKFSSILKTSAVALSLIGVAMPINNNVISSSYVHADDNDAKADELQDKMDNLLKQENNLKSKINAARGQLMKTNNNISNADIKISSLQSQLSDKRTSLQDKQAQIQQMQNTINKEQKQLTDLYRTMQDKNDNNNLISLKKFLPSSVNKDQATKDSAKSVVLNAKKHLIMDKAKLNALKSEHDGLQNDLDNLADQITTQKKVKSNLKTSLDKNDFVRNSFSPDRLNKVQQLQDKHDQLEKQFEDLTSNIIDQTSSSSKSDLAKQKKALSKIQQKMSKSTDNLNQMTGHEMDNLKVNLNEVNKAIDEASDQSSASSSDNSIISPTTTDNSSTQNAIVKMALKYVGVPYVWGGTSPSGFDCSGLVQYVYSHAANISLPRVSQSQSTVGKYLGQNWSALKPGDLLFWGGIGSAHHVAIYIGNQEFVQAPEPGQNVKITKISWYTPSFARRVL